jgi:methyl-accepting chemotaxis protein
MKESMALSLKLKTRLIYGLILVCFAALGAVGLDRLARIRSQSDIMSEVWTPRLHAAEELGGVARDYRISEAVRIVSVTPDMAEQADADLADYADTFQTNLAAYRKLLRPKEAAAQVDAVETNWASYIASNQEMLAMARAGDSEGAANRFRNSASKFYLVADALEKLAEQNVKQAKAAQATAAEVYRESRLFMIAALAVITGLLFAIGAFFELRVWRALVQMSALLQRLARGDLDVDVHGGGRGDEVGAMARALQVFKDNGLEVRRLENEAKARAAAEEEERRRHDAALAATAAEREQVVSVIGACLAELSKGNLSVRAMEQFPSEFEILRQDFNAALGALQDAMKAVSTGTTGILGGAQEISRAADQLAQRTEHQAATLEETAAALEQLTQTVHSSAENAKRVKSATDSARRTAERSGEVVREAVAAMSEIERSAQQITDIIGVVDEIAFQTNLLALNAGVEAARAGDAGKGFAVVASEVRALAQRAAQAAKEIKGLISSSSEHVASGVQLVGETGTALGRIVTEVTEINRAIGEISAVADEQAVSLTQVNQSVSQMDKATQQNAAMAEESTAASRALAMEASEVARSVGRFDLGGGGKPIPRPVRAEPEPEPARSTQWRSATRFVQTGGAALARRAEPDMDEDWTEF